jgi:hypothetical protein
VDKKDIGYNCAAAVGEEEVRTSFCEQKEAKKL